MRLIDADALKHMVKSMNFASLFVDVTRVLYSVGIEIDNAPTIDAVEVVRCRDCTYAVKSKRVEKSCFPVFCAILEARMKDDDYCSQGDKND